MIEDTWKGLDPDDVAGYLLDYLNSKLSIDGEPMSDEVLWDTLRNDDGDWAGEILENIRNAIRAKNAEL